MQCTPPSTLTVIPSFFCEGKKWGECEYQTFLPPLNGPHTVPQPPGPENLQKIKQKTFLQGTHCTLQSNIEIAHLGRRQPLEGCIIVTAVREIVSVIVVPGSAKPLPWGSPVKRLILSTPPCPGYGGQAALCFNGYPGEEV